MGSRGASSANGKTTGGMGSGDGGADAPKSKAQAIAEQIDPELTAAFLEVVMSDGNMFTNRTAEKAVQESMTVDRFNMEVARLLGVN